MQTKQAIKNKLFQMNPVVLTGIIKLAGKGKKNRDVLNLTIIKILVCFS